MSFQYHKNLTNADLHVPGYIQSADPGGIGAKRLWIDTSAGTGEWVIKIRNDANDGWETISKVNTFLELGDVPSSFSASGDLLRVNSGANALEFYTPVDLNEKVKISSNDTTADYLLSKLLAGNAITLTEESDGSDEKITIAVDESGIDASLIPIIDAGSIITATEIEGALQENRIAIDLNTAKDTNVSTSLSVGTVGVNTVAITSDGGADDVTLPAATVSTAGMLTTAKWAEIVANNAKNTNVSTALSAGTVTSTTYGITSDGGADDIVLPEADTNNAGLLGADKWDEIVANSVHSADNSQAHSDYLINNGDDETTGSFRATRFRIDNDTTYIDKDGSDNMTFTDVVVGTRTLKQLGCPTYKYISAVNQSEGNLNLTGAGWAVSKAIIKTIKVTTTSTDYDIWLYSDDGFSSDEYQIMEAGNTNSIIFLDFPYVDGDSSNEIHLKYTSNSGSEIASFDIRGFELL